MGLRRLSLVVVALFTAAGAHAGDHKADLFFAIGSSLVVQPAATLPVVAKRAGAKLVIINRDETPVDYMADAVVHAGIGETLSAIGRLL